MPLGIWRAVDGLRFSSVLWFWDSVVSHQTVSVSRAQAMSQASLMLSSVDCPLWALNVSSAEYWARLSTTFLES